MTAPPDANGRRSPPPAELVAEVESAARKIRTPCGAGEMVWRVWGDGPPVVLFHGNFGTWMHWIRNVSALSRRYTVIVPDTPGFGDSAMPPVPCRAHDIGAILAEGLEQIFDISEPIRLVGFSYGGRLAGEVARILGDRLESLILVAPGGLGIEDAPWPELAKLRPRMTREDIANVHRHNLAAMMIADPAKVDDLAVYIQHKNTRRARFRLTSWPEEDVWGCLARALPDIAVPVHGIWSTGDAFAGDTLARRLAVVRAAHPDADIRMMEGLGHWMFYEDAEAFNAVLSALLALPDRPRP